MSKYNLERLGWFNFEQLVGCLLREVIGSGVSSFSGSADQGRDATYSGRAAFPSVESPLEGEWIFQVKHRQWGARGVSMVRSELSITLKTELTKICKKYKHKCNFYVFITNCPLTSSNKDELEVIIESQESIEKGFILGEEDVEQLLDIHPKVVRAFPQIMGVGQLRELMNWGIRQRSLSYLQQVQTDLDTYVVTEAYLKARELLNKKHFCIISGAPKMGKSCTASAIAASFAADDFSIIELRDQQNFYDMMNDEEKQLFICDDVFGDISLQANKRDDWARGLAKLLRNLGNQCKLLWTARAYILKESIESSKLEEERPTLTTTDNVTVSVDHLKRMEKAMILYNHAKKAQLPEKARTLLKDICLKIIDHECFAPESIRQLCTGRFAEFTTADMAEKQFLPKVQDFLSHPGDAWKRAFSNAPQEEQLLCIELMSDGGRVPYEEFRARYETWRAETGTSVLSFEEAFGRAEGSFLKRKILWGGQVYVMFYHPSMRDLLVEVIESDMVVRQSYIERLTFDELKSLIVSSGKARSDASSSAHKVKLTSGGDLDQLKSHLMNKLLPSMQFEEANSILAQLVDEVEGSENTAKLSPAVKLILNIVVEAACSEDFWMHCAVDSMRPFLVHRWAVMLEYLDYLIGYTEKDLIPLYIGELLEKSRDYKRIEFWELCAAAKAISSTLTQKHVDFSKRQLCREALIDNVENAVAYNEEELESDIEVRNAWNEEYSSVLSDCEKFQVLFPEDEEIEGVDSLENLLDNYPSVEPEPDHEDHYSAMDSGSSEDSTILDIFSDL